MPYSWRPLYREAVLEVNQTELLRKIEESRRAISARLDEVWGGSNKKLDVAERQAIVDARCHLALLVASCAGLGQIKVMARGLKEVPFPLCVVCNEPVDLTTAKTDGDGKAVHEDCYVKVV